MIKIRFYAGLANHTKCTETEMNGGPLTVGKLLEELSSQYPNARFEGVLVAVNGASARKTSTVEAGSLVALLPPIAGG
ncbi:MAG: ThiS family [Paenibacillaceae bacterium]|jgi:molybdopterin converting factor small subunit|nr:ThiS family [Paenibacillaceae bacterium]